MSKIFKSNNFFKIAEIDGTYEKLPVGVYNLNKNNSGYFLTKTNDFTLPEKIYGDMSIVDRWIKTYNDKKRNVGILLSGLKGGGKTITAKLLAIKTGKPIINISEPFHGPDFIDFITNPVLGDCVIFLDEFEKVYSPNSDDGNDSLLSLLDGPYETHHLFIFTVNQTNISSSFINRPSRILYLKQYEGIDEKEIIEIANDKLINKNFMKDLLETSHRIFHLSYDILISIIEESNRFNEAPSECIKYMNLTPMNISFNIEQWYNNGNIESVNSGYSVDTVHTKNGIICHAKLNFVLISNDISYKYKFVPIPLDKVKKVTNDSYEYFDEHFFAKFILTETNFDKTYGYSFKKSYVPEDVKYDMLKVYLDDEKYYKYHTPKEIQIETVKEIIGSQYFKGEKVKESYDLPYDGACCAG